MLYKFGLMSSAPIPQQEFYAAFGINVNPFFYVYKAKGSNYEKIPDPVDGITIAARGVSLSRNGQSLITCTASKRAARRLELYSISNITLTKLPAPDVLLSSIANGCNLRPQDDFYAVATSSTPFLHVYAFDGTNSTKLPNPSTLPPGTSAEAVEWEPMGESLVVRSNDKTLSRYRFNPSLEELTFLNVISPDNLPSNSPLVTSSTISDSILP